MTDIAACPAFVFECGCPACEAPLTVTNQTRPPTVHESTVIVECTMCRLEAEVRVTLDVLHDPRYTRPPKGRLL